MDAEVVEVAGERCVVVAAGGPVVRDASGARDLIEAAMSERATMIVVPVEGLDASFFELRSGLAGEVLQKMVNYHLRIAIVGDVSPYVAASDALRDFVVECDRGRSVYFVADLEELTARLTGASATD